MTAETLKPFITTTSAEHFIATDHHQKSGNSSNRQKNSNILPIALSVVAIVLGISLLGFTVWISLRFIKLEFEVDNLNGELKSLQKVVENMRNRLGLHYLDDLNEFKKEYEHALLENPSSYDEDKDIEIDSKENPKIEGKYIDEEYDDYNDRLDVLAKQYEANMGIGKDDDDDDNDDNEDDVEEEADNKDKATQDKTDENVSDDDNFYDDFEKYQHSKRRDRKVRSVLELVNDPEPQPNKSEFSVDSNEDKKLTQRHRSPLSRRQHFVSNKNPTYPKYPFLHKNNHRSRKSRVIKSDDSLLSAKAMPTMYRDNSIPAAHFQLNRKIPHRHSGLKIDSYNGDVYIGSPVWSNDANNFDVENGIFRTREPGLYYIYAQICYNNTYDHNGFIIFHGHKPFLQCLNTVPTHLSFKIHTCHTSGLINLEANETIHLRDIHSDRDVVLKETNNRSFFGFMKIK